MSMLCRFISGRRVDGCREHKHGNGTGGVALCVSIDK